MSSRDSEPGLLRRVAEAYEAEAEDYRELWAPVLNSIALELVKELPQAARVLDLATGVGTLLPALRQELGAHLVVGLDASAGMLALADPSFGRVVGDVTRLPVRSATFDGAVLAFVLFHLPRPEEALAEARRVLRRGGSVATITWGNEVPPAADAVWTEELDRRGAGQGPATARWHELVDSEDKVAALLQGVGFRSIRAWIIERRDDMTPERFIERRSRLGINRRRLSTLEPSERSACVAAAYESVRVLGQEAFRSEWRFVLATARC